MGEEQVAGLDIREDYITVASCVFGKGGSFKIENLGWIRNEVHTSNRATASLIRKLWHRHHIETRTVSFSLHSPSLVLKYFKYPDLSKQELESALQLEAEQVFQRPQKELSIDWYLYPQALHSSNVAERGTVEGILVAVPREIIDRYLTILRMAGLYPIILDVSCMALSSLFLKLRESSKDKVTCLVNLASYSADFSILAEGSYIYPRNLYSQAGPWEDRTGDLLENIKDILAYYQFKLRRKSVENLVLTGRLSFNERFQEDIKKSVELPIEFWNPLKEISFKKNIASEEIKAYGPIMATSLGLAIRRQHNGF